METHAITIFSLLILGFGLISARVQNSVVTPPMVFVAAGFLVSARGIGWLELHTSDEVVRLLTEITLVLVLFTDAARIRLDALRRDFHLPLRLLGIGLPLTIVLGAIVAAAMFAGLNVWEAAVVAAILAPTDAALGQAIVSSPRVPARIRQALNVESGLNDGIALPVVLILLALATAAGDPGSLTSWSVFTAKQVILGPLVGIAIGWGGGFLVHNATRAGWMSLTFQKLSALSISFLAFSCAEMVGGNGFIAAFVAGLTIGNTARTVCTCLIEFGEVEGQLLALMVFTILGGVVLLPVIDQLTWPMLAYAVLSLTIVRMLPVALATLGAGLRIESVAVLGWFGPRGLASIVFGLLALERSGIAGRETMFAIVIATVLLSVFAHGLTAVPASKWYEARLGPQHMEPERPEFAEVIEMPVRISHGPTLRDDAAS